MIEIFELKETTEIVTKFGKLTFGAGELFIPRGGDEYGEYDGSICRGLIIPADLLIKHEVESEYRFDIEREFGFFDLKFDISK